MAMVVRSNLMAYNANRQLGMNNSAVSKNLEKLSSGFKINRAADDAAGLAVSEKMKAQIKGLEQASLNSQDGISLVQTAEGALTEVHDMLNRMTELATKSANGTIQDDVDREAIQNEVNKLNEEIDRIAESTNFNGINLLDGSLSGGGVSGSAYSSVKVGTGAATTVTGTKAASSITFSTLGATTSSFSIEMEINVDGKLKKVSYSGKVSGSNQITSDTDFVKAIQNAVGDKYKVDASTAGTIKIEALTEGNDKIQINAGVKISENGTALAAASAPTVGTVTIGKQNVLKVTGTITTAGTDNVIEIDGKKFEVLKRGETAAKGNIAIYTDDGKIAAGDADQMKAVAEQLKEYGVEVTVDGNNFEFAKAAAGAATSNSSSGGLTLQIGDTGDDFNQVSVSVQNMKSDGIGTKGLDVSTQDAAKSAIQLIKDGINYVSSNRSEMGALQNRLEHAINNLDVAAENMTNANSRIRDTDMAKQMMEYTKMNVLTQSAQAMLAQANQNPQSILQLLQ